MVKNRGGREGLRLKKQSKEKEQKKGMKRKAREAAELIEGENFGGEKKKERQQRKIENKSN